jgi:hypothetical protein
MLSLGQNRDRFSLMESGLQVLVSEGELFDGLAVDLDSTAEVLVLAAKPTKAVFGSVLGASAGGAVDSSSRLARCWNVGIRSAKLR